MQRYIIILICLLGSSVIYYLLSKILKKLQIKNANYLSILTSIIFFIITVLFSFFYFEPHNNITLKYTPPKIIDGKIEKGKFK